MPQSLSDIIAVYMDPEPFMQERFPERRERALEKARAAEAAIRKAFQVTPRDADNKDE